MADIVAVAKFDSDEIAFLPRIIKHMFWTKRIIQLKKLLHRICQKVMSLFYA